MRVSKYRQQPVKTKVANKGLFDSSLTEHNKRVQENYHKGIILQYYVQFYRTMVAREEDHIDSCSIKDLKQIPADDFFLLCEEFSQLNVEYQKTHQSISPLQLQQRMSRKEKVVFDDKKRKLKEKEYEIAVKKILKHMHNRSPATQKQFWKLCEEKKRELHQINKFRQQIKDASWKQIDERTKMFIHDIHHYKETVIIQGETLELVIKIFKDLAEIADKNRDLLSNRNGQTDYQEQTESLHLFLHQFITLIDLSIPNIVIEDVNLKKFEEIITDLTAISEEYIKRTATTYSIDRKRLSEIEDIFLYEVDQCLTIISDKGEYMENPYARNKMQEIIEKLTKCTRQILKLMKLTSELF